MACNRIAGKSGRRHAVCNFRYENGAWGASTVRFGGFVDKRTYTLCLELKNSQVAAIDRECATLDAC